MSRKKISIKARLKGPSPEQVRRKNLLIGGVIGICVVVLIAVIAVSLSRPAPSTSPVKAASSQQSSSASLQVPAVAGQNAINIQGLIVKDLKVGTGSAAKNGDSVTVNYVGTLTDGTVFDSSIARNQPFTFTIGAGQVIKGWDMGIAGMKVGGERKLVIPPSLGYGSTAMGNQIPPNSTLNFTVTLLKINN